jgi:hypothetical protein
VILPLRNVLWLFGPAHRNKCLRRTFEAAEPSLAVPRLSRIAKGLRTRCYSPLALARIAKGDGCLHNLPKLSNAMDDLSDLVTGMLGVAIAAIMLVAGELYLVTRPDPPDTYSEPPSIVTSSIEQQPR